MDCARADQLMQQAAAETLSADDRAALWGHLVGCPDCAARCDELRFAELTEPARVPEMELPPELTARLLAIEEQPRSAIELALGEPLRLSAPALAFAALVMGLLLMLTVPAVDDGGVARVGSGRVQLGGPNAELLEGLLW